MNRDDRDPIPRTALWLSTAGLIPFVVCTSALFAMPGSMTPTLVFWLIGYAAVILGFVGAVHWGCALVHPKMGEADRGLVMAWSVVPALAGWASLLLPPQTGLLLLAAAFAVQYGADRQLAQRFVLPGWYVKLRGGLSAVVVLCLLFALARIARG